MLSLFTSRYFENASMRTSNVLKGANGPKNRLRLVYPGLDGLRLSVNKRYIVRILLSFSITIVHI